MKISASIVTYNSADEIREVLDSLAVCEVQGLKIYVVDNASTDSTVGIVEKEYPQITLIKSETNIGFGAGHNLALKKVDGLKTKVVPVSTSEYGLSKAARPFNSRLDKSKLVEAGFEPLPDWKDAVSRYLKEANL